MANSISSSKSDKSSRDVTNNSKAIGRSDFSSDQDEDRDENQMSQSQKDGSQLEQFIMYMKENWRPIATELVAAGVTAYLSHHEQAKAAKRNH